MYRNTWTQESLQFCTHHRIMKFSFNQNEIVYVLRTSQLHEACSVYQLVRIKFDVFLGLICLMNLILILFHFHVFKNLSSMSVILSIDMHLDVQKLIYFKLSMVLATTRVFSCVSVWLTFHFVLGERGMRRPKQIFHLTKGRMTLAMLLGHISLMNPMSIYPA